ncbi:MAG: hypothetical protein ACR2MO_13045 [Acidimicrobiales bacterium]
MNDAALRDGREDSSAIGYVLVVALVLAALARWVSDVTSGGSNRYDLPVVNYLSWFAFLLFATITFMAAIGAVFRLVELVRPARPGTTSRT